MAVDSSVSDEGVAVSFFVHIQGLGCGVALPEKPFKGHSWPVNCGETPGKWQYAHRLYGILCYSGSYE